MRALLVCLCLLASGALADPVPGAAASLNGYRAQAGRPALTEHPALQATAEAHARDMVQRRYFSHTGADGSSVGDRLRAQGYRWCHVAENIAKGQTSLGQVMDGWFFSPGHRTNMIARDAVHFGLARSGTAKDAVWVMVFARPC